MIKIGNDKLFSQSELLEAAREYFKNETIPDLRNGKCGFEIKAIAAIIGESPEYVIGAITAGR